MAVLNLPIRQPYVMPTTRQERLWDSVNQAFWWEVLCMLKPLPLIHIEAIVSLLGDPLSRCSS